MTGVQTCALPISARYGVGYDQPKGCIVFPYWRPDGSIHRFKLRDKNGQRYSKGDGVIPFGLNTLDGQGRAFVCEGETDTLRLSQELGESEAVLGIPGVQSIKCLDDYLPGDATLYSVFDTDEPGRDATLKAVKRYGARPVYLPEGVKDVCEYFQAGHSLRDFLGLVEAADGEAAEADDWMAGKLQVTRGGYRFAYQAPGLEKLPGQPEGYLRAALPVLAALRPLDYGRCRKQVAKDGGVAVQYIDAEVKPLQPKEKNDGDRKSTRLNSSHIPLSRMPSSA